MKILLGVISALCLANTALCEEYTNRPYGISIRTQGDWRIVRTAKLDVDLHELSAEQLTELFQAYQGFGVVRLAKGDDNQLPLISIQFMTSRGSLKSALEYAEGYENGAKSSKEEILVSATERGFAGIPAAYLATKRQRPRGSVIWHQFFVRRARSYVVITCMLQDGDAQKQFDELMGLLSNVTIDLDADSRNMN